MTKYKNIASSILLFFAPIAMGLGSEPPFAKGEPQAAQGNSTVTIAFPSLDEARRQAEILHAAMHATLQIVHQRFYREDEDLPLPAATLEEVFAELEEEQHIKLRWLAVEGLAMNDDHKPRGSFENDAVQSLKSGNQKYERTENGVYRRAGSITLTNHCLKCHVPDRKTMENRTAGLIISIPIERNGRK